MSTIPSDDCLKSPQTLVALRDWINETNKTEEISINLESPSPISTFFSTLKDGVAICKLITKLKGRFVMFNKNPRGMEFMEHENCETFLKEVKLLLPNTSSAEFIGKDFHKLCATFDEKSPLIIGFLKLLVELSDNASQKHYKGPLLTINSDSITFGKAYGVVTSGEKVETTPVSSLNNSTTTSTSSVPTKSFTTSIPEEKNESKTNTGNSSSSKVEIDKELKQYKQDQLDLIKQQVEKYKLIEEDKIKREIKQMRQQMVLDLQKEQREMERDMKKSMEKENPVKPQPVSKTIVTREKRISIELSKDDDFKSSAKPKHDEHEPTIMLKKKIDDLHEKLIGTEVKYEKLLDDMRDQLTRKKKEVERLEEENMLLAKRLKKLKSQKLTDGLEELDREDVSSKSIKSLHTLLATTNIEDDDCEAPHFKPSSTSQSSQQAQQQQQPASMRTRDALPSVRFISPPLKIQTPSADNDNELIDEEAIQVDDPSLLEMSDDEDNEDDFSNIQLETPVLRKTAPNTIEPIHRSFDDEEELFESSYADLKSSSKKSNNKSKKSVFSSAVIED